MVVIASRGGISKAKLVNAVLGVTQEGFQERMRHIKPSLCERVPNLTLGGTATWTQRDTCLTYQFLYPKLLKLCELAATWLKE